MKPLLYFPLAYIANVHGFILLAPYLVIFLTVVRTVQVMQNASRTKPVLIPASRALPAVASIVR